MLDTFQSNDSDDSSDLPYTFQTAFRKEPRSRANRTEGWDKCESPILSVLWFAGSYLVVVGEGTSFIFSLSRPTRTGAKLS